MTLWYRTTGSCLAERYQATFVINRSGGNFVNGELFVVGPDLTTAAPYELHSCTAASPDTFDPSVPDRRHLVISLYSSHSLIRLY